MAPTASILSEALASVGLLCSAHYDAYSHRVRFQWAEPWSTDDEGEMIASEFQAAAVADRPYAAEFHGVSNYVASNQDNLQVGYLLHIKIDAEEHAGRCRIDFADSPEAAPAFSTEFSFASAVPLRM